MTSRIEALKEKAKKSPKKIVLPEGHEPRVLQAAETIISQKLASLILVGKPDEIRNLAAANSVSLNGVEIINPEEYPRRDEMIEVFYNARKHKGVTKDDAKNAVLGNCVYFGALLVKLGVADGFVAGASHTTSNVARAGLFCIGLDKDMGVMSGSFLVEIEDCEYGERGLFVFADCGIIPNPTPEQLADIAISSSRLYEALFSSRERGKKPHVALLSYSTKGSARGESVDKVLKALEIIRKKSPGLQVDGELQLDAAIASDVAKIKAPASKVAGRANVLVFPNLDAGNISYKLVQRLGKARVVGPLLQGLAKPGSDLSRGCRVEEIIDAVVATALRAK